MKGLGGMRSFGDMVKQAQKVQKKMSELQDQLAAERLEASAGGGLVRAVVDGNGRVVELKLDPRALEEKDVTLIEDLLVTAVGEAQKQAEERKKESVGAITGGFQLPF